MRDEILIFSRSLPMHGLGGMEIVAWDLACELAKSKHNVYVITTSIADKPANFVENGVNVVALSNTPSGCYSSKWWRASRSYFENNHMDTVSSVLSVSASGLGVLPCKKQLLDVPFVFQAHGTSWGECLSKWKSKNTRKIATSLKNLIWLPKDILAYRRFDYIVAVGQRVHKDLTNPPICWAIRKEKIKLISNGIDNELFSSGASLDAREDLNMPPDKFILISASRLHSQKGVAHGLKAFKLFLDLHPESLYLIAGEGPEKNRLEKMARDLNIDENVIFLGRLDRESLARYLKAADVFLFLTEHVEGLPLNVLEAMATGIPAIVSEHLSFFDSEHIYKVNPRNYTLVSSSLKSICERTDKYLDSNKSFLPEEYTLKCVGREYENLLTDAL